MENFKFQLGQFFLVIGVIMLALFFLTGEGHTPQFLLFFGGVLIAGGGISLMTRNRTPSASESARFRQVRHLRQKSRERREKKRQRLLERREGHAGSTQRERSEDRDRNASGENRER